MLHRLLVAISLVWSSAKPIFKLGINTAMWEQDDARGAYTSYLAWKQGASYVRDLEPSWEDLMSNSSLLITKVRLEKL
jgi:hypothetical protein